MDENERSRTAGTPAYCDRQHAVRGQELRQRGRRWRTFYRDNGFTLEQYREGAALSGPWLRYDAESGTQFANYLAAGTADYGGCYIISAYWKPTDETS